MAEPVYDADPAAGDGCAREEASGAARPARVARTASGPEFTLQADGDRVVVAVRGELDLDSAERLGHALRAALTAAVDGVDLDLGGVVFCDCSALNVLLGLRERGLKQGKAVGIRSAGPAVERLLTLTGTDTLFATPAAPTARHAAPTGDRNDAGDDTADRDRDGRGSGDREADGGDTGDRDRDSRAGDHDASGRDASGRDTGGHDTDGPDAGDHGTGNHDTRRRAPDRVEQELRIEVVQLRRAMQTRPVIDLARGILMASFALSAEDAWRVLVEASQHTNTKLHHLAGELVSAVQGEPPAEGVQEQLAAAVAKVRSEPPAADRIEQFGE